MGAALITLLVLLLVAVLGLTFVLLRLVRAGTLGVSGGAPPPASNPPPTREDTTLSAGQDEIAAPEATAAGARDAAVTEARAVGAAGYGATGYGAPVDTRAAESATEAGGANLAPGDEAAGVGPPGSDSPDTAASALDGWASAEAGEVGGAGEAAEPDGGLGTRVELAEITQLTARIADLRREAREAREDGDGIRRRAEQDAAEQIARVEREAAQIRRHAEEAAEAIRARAVADAELRASKAEAEAREAIRVEREQLRAELDEDLRSQRAELRGWDTRLSQREQRLAEQSTAVEEQARRLQLREEELAAREAGLDGRETDLAGQEARLRRELERAAGLTSAEARTELVKVVEDQARLEAAVRVREVEARAEEEGEDRARRIVTLAIQRVASEQTAESVVSVLHLPSDEMKGRIIGREGRNIRAFESVTGVNVLIDDTPEAVLLSCFDPVRRETARITLAALVSDGRIHPHRIEEEYARAEREVMAKCVRAGEDALIDVGIAEMHPELITLLGRLRYRTSYGQNVLAHLVESAHLAGIMAAELRLPPAIAKRGTLLHDLGKALTHEVEGSHAIVGAEIARRYGEHEDVVHAIEAHHNEVEPRSIGAVLTQAADQISGGRPGARRDSLESYVKRLERIEQIAAERPGVEKVFAMQAGREVRVMVVPELVDDVAAHLLARDVAKQIEDELTYPGQIRVTVVRETRAIGLAR
ncbi:ribonucrease Y [Frankia sp. EI5c]|uniref:ribonuclease Y n=1 Tax=Frankia sp. EI5c TaxID=683316 RepID=UPI0007C39187|nr:ribonuclease Y [Frankia sp. EI5c]OAA24752.1 ribonucrease Y [Frankia sp. EI5c]